MATEPGTTGVTYEVLWEFPDDMHIREVLDGELLVTPAPVERHQRVTVEITGRFWLYAREQGGRAYTAPTGVFFTETNYVEPDVFYLRPESLGKVEKAFIRGGPDLVVEVSSPSTRRIDRTRKKDLYERSGVPEYWFVDLDADRIEVHRLEAGRYPAPTVLGAGDTLSSPVMPGFSATVEEILDPSGDRS